MYTSWASARGAWSPRLRSSPRTPSRALRRRHPYAVAAIRGNWLAAGEARSPALSHHEIRVDGGRRDRGHRFLAPRPSQSSLRRR